MPKIKNLTSFKLISFIINSNNASLLDNIINKNYKHCSSSTKKIASRRIILYY